MPFKSLVLCSALSLAGMNTWAAGNFVSLSGDVHVETNDTASPAAVRQRVEAGTTVHTGNSGNAVLRLDDGQQVVLSPNTSFKIDQFRFDNAKPEQNSISMSMFKGALRILTGLIGQRDNSKFVLRTPSATVGIRGTDFMVAMVNPVYLSVIQGAVTTTNAAGTAVFSAGMTATVTSSAALGAAIPASALPSSVAASFSSLSSAAMTASFSAASSTTGAGAGGSGATGATGAAAGGLGTLGVTTAGVLGAAAVISASKTSTTGTTGTQ